MSSNFTTHLYNHQQEHNDKGYRSNYERGVIRPLPPLELPEGARLDLIVITHEQPESNGTAEILAQIAALPLEGSNDSFAGREHDSVLYPKK
jgi:predicted DNA-binding antitoxin AbrB/MazE fold protein